MPIPVLSRPLVQAPPWMPATAANRYDARRAAYNVKASNTRRLRAGHGKADKGQRVHEVVIGDSISSGWTSGSAVDRANAWPQVYRQSLGLPSGGTGWLRTSDNGTLDPRMAYAGTWTTLSNSVYCTATGSTITFTADSVGAAVQVLWMDSSSGWTLSVDGATSGLGFFSTTGSNNGGTGIVTNVPADIHPGSKIVITSTTANVVQFMALAVLNSSGIVIDNVAQKGSSAAGTGANSWSDPSTGAAGSVAYNNQILNMYGPGSYETTPSCVHIMLLLNDAQAPYTVAQYTAAVTTIRNKFPNSDCVLHLQPQPNAVTAATWTPYAAALYQLADTLDVPLIDHWDALGGYDVETANGLTGDTVAHLTVAGYAQMARTVSAAFSGAGFEDAATVAAVRARAVRTFRATSNGVMPPSNAVSLGNSGALTSGVTTFFPFDVGPDNLTIKGLAAHAVQTQVGGTGTLSKGAVYADRGDGGGPLIAAAGLLGQVTFDGTVGNLQTRPLTMTLPPGRYWLAGFYYQGTTAPTVAPTFATLGAGTAIGAPASTAFTVAIGLQTTGGTDLPTTGTAAPVTAVGNGFAIGLVAA